MYHDLETGKTKQLTHGTQNNSNPHIFGDRVVWQGWVQDNWEIFMADDVDEEEFTVTRLTENNTHDMFPQVYDGIVTWQAEAGEAWEIVVYDMVSGERSRLKKEGDGRYENPRFVLLFENRTKEGDVETIGYDVETGEMMPLGARPGKEKPIEPVVPQDHQDAVPVAAATSTVKTERRDGGDE
jgi:beta propeller repeat protein